MLNRFKLPRNGFKLPGYGVEFSRRGFKLSRRRTLWGQISHFAEQKPLLFVGAVLATVFLLVLVMRSLFGESNDRYHHSDNQAERSAARMGATEEQVTRSQPSATALQSGETTTTGAAYGFDQQSITPG
ncbi:MAG: hypothetical protein DCC55_09085 [Chloroflexi bacterium]|nr:MAG: hypothetical protein DCC55_09085 [Chloroflexota bacterium]